MPRRSKKRSQVCRRISVIQILEHEWVDSCHAERMRQECDCIVQQLTLTISFAGAADYLSKWLAVAMICGNISNSRNSIMTLTAGTGRKIARSVNGQDDYIPVQQL